MIKSIRNIGIALLAVFIFAGCCSIVQGPWCNETPSLNGHKASFLLDNGGTRVMNILSPNLAYNNFQDIVKRCINNGDNTIYLYLMNEKDGPWTPYSMYVNNQIGGALNEAIVKEYEKRIEYIRSKDLGIVFFLRADDSPNFNKVMVRGKKGKKGKKVEKIVYTAPPEVIPPIDESFLTNGVVLSFNKRSTASQEQYQKDAVRLFDADAMAWIVGLEANEYYSDGTINHYANQLQGLTSKHIGVHLTPMKYSAALQSTIDGLWLQYGFNKSPSQIASDTKSIISKMGGKPVHATEYNLSSDSATAKAQGDQAYANGAKSTGNGRN